MAKSPDIRPGTETDSEVWNAIAILEQILEAMPGNRDSLDALVKAYEQVGDGTRARSYVVRLAKVILDEKDAPAAVALLSKLKAYSGDDPEASALVTRIEELKATATGAPPATGKPEKKPATEALLAMPSISEEISLAWKLLQAKVLTQEEYSHLVQDLTELSGTSKAGTVSALHVLQARGAKNLEDILVYLSRESNTPIVPLSGFELRKEVLTLIPLPVMIRRGVVAFETVGSDLLVAVMNPLDRALRRELEKLTGRKCHCYLTLPSDFDAVVEKTRQMEKEE